MKNKGLLKILCAVFVVSIIVATIASCDNNTYWCDHCGEWYEDGKHHNVLYQEKVDMTLCDECYDTYVSTGELPLKD